MCTPINIQREFGSGPCYRINFMIEWRLRSSRGLRCKTWRTGRRMRSGCRRRKMMGCFGGDSDFQREWRNGGRVNSRERWALSPESGGAGASGDCGHRWCWSTVVVSSCPLSFFLRYNQEKRSTITDEIGNRIFFGSDPDWIQFIDNITSHIGYLRKH